MQYSYLPSWLSFLVDQEQARDAGRALFDAVYERWSELPAGRAARAATSSARASGSFGGETAFSGEADLRNRTAGALFAGPPELQPALPRVHRRPRPGQPRDRAGLPRRPDGPLRQRPGAGDPARRTSRGTGTRVLYLMHPSDPIVWWSPDLSCTEPDWLARAAGATCSARCLDPVRHLLAGDRGPPVRDRGPGRARAQVHDGVRRRMGVGFLGPAGWNGKDHAAALRAIDPPPG